MMDPYFRVEVLARTLDPQTLIWQAMHQDYSEHYVFDEEPPTETDAGDLVIRHLLKGGRGHYGPLEHPSISFAVGGFPHSVMQQARTHRVGVSFDVQSMRYTGQRICSVAQGQLPLEAAFYLRPVGEYTNRQGKKYSYTKYLRDCDLIACRNAATRYANQISAGMSEEHARGTLPFDYRQNFVVSFSLRALMHFLDLRAKADAQAEIHTMCELLMPHFQAWTPALAAWYSTTRWGKARLAP